MNFGTFICSKCAGIHRDFNHKVKGTGVSIFTEKDIELVTNMGNDVIIKKFYVRMLRRFG